MTLTSEKGFNNFTYEDFLRWNYIERWEIIDGIAYNKTFCGSREYQKISGIIFTEISNYLKGKPLEIYRAPFPVKLSENTVIQPDMAVCDENIIDDRVCNGSPELLIDIICNSSQDDDMNMKLNLYERSGIKECWLVYPLYKIIRVLSPCKNRSFRSELYRDKFKSVIFGDFELDLNEVFLHF